MQAVAAELGLAVGGNVECCVEFGWIEGGSTYTHNFGPRFYGRDGCYSGFPTLEACEPA